MNKITFESSPMSRSDSEEFGHLNFLYQHIEPSEYQFDLLNRENLAKISPNDFMVCLNATKKSRFFLVLNSFNSVNQALFIAYGKHCSSSQVWATHIQATEALFKGTIFDGDLIQNNLGELSFVISDIYLYAGQDVSHLDVKERRKLVNLEKDFVYNKYLSKLTFQWNPVFECGEISNALQKECNFDFNGIMFIPRKPGHRWIFRVDQQPVQSETSKRPEHDKGDKLTFQIEQTDLPDVYPISSNKIDYGHLYIPTKALSLKIRQWVQDGAVKVSCQFNGKKWIPKSLVK